MTDCTDQIISCGYTGRIIQENKERIIRAITLHSAARRTVMLSQLREGLQLYGLMDVMCKNSALCKGFFVTGKDEKVDVVNVVCVKLIVQITLFILRLMQTTSCPTFHQY